MITGLNHITLAVTDIEKSFRFYREVLQFKPLCKWSKGAYFLVGDLWFCLNVDVARVPQSDYTHYAFSVSKDDFSEMENRLLLSGVKMFQENKKRKRFNFFLVFRKMPNVILLNYKKKFSLKLSKQNYTRKFGADEIFECNYN